MKLAIIGLGYVGDTIYRALRVEGKKAEAPLAISRIDPPKGFNTSYESIADCDGVFVCEPSPMDKDGSADTSILEGVLSNLKAVNYSNVIISKVTAPPDVYRRLHESNPNLVHVPEFLTAVNAYFDYVTNPTVIVGGDFSFAEKASKIINLSKNEHKETIYCSIVDAAVIKYAINSFLATKVIFFNELKSIAERSGASWSNVRRIVASDNRIGESHSHAPGSDGQYGFGGLCFPKDTAAFLHYADSIGIKFEVLNAAVMKNREIFSQDI